MKYSISYGKLERKVQSMLYTPSENPKKRIGILLMHSDGDYLRFTPAAELAKRGYTVLAANVSDSREPLDDKIRDLRICFCALKKKEWVEKILLLGHSGGATLMSAYQAVAENGCSVFQDEGRVIPIDDLGEVPAADGVMLLDPNFGNGAMTLLSLDPAIIDETSGVKKDPNLDLFSPGNGYDPDKPTYTDEFISRFTRAQGQRMNRLIDYARERVALIDAGKGNFIDDEPMFIPGGSQIGPNNKLFPMMTRFFSRTEGVYEHIRKNGTIVTERVMCVRRPRENPDSAKEMHFGGLMTTVRTFLKSSAVRAEENFGYDESRLYGVNWDSSFCCTTGNVRHISVPMLMMGMTGSYEYIAAEHVYREAVKCSDKSIAFVEGAGHNFREIDPQYGDTTKRCFDYADRWIRSRFAE